MQEKLIICSLEDLRNVSELVSAFIQSTGRNVVLLNGDLGTGKTSFVKDFVKLKTGLDQADSPTFSLVNDYDYNQGIIHHFDLYRIDSQEEIEDIGFWDYIESGNPCFIEWPDKIAHILPEEKLLNISIELNLNQCREFSVSY